MQRSYFNRELLLSVVKPAFDSHAILAKNANPRPANQLALAIIHPGEDASGLLSALVTINPGARILEITAPEGQDNLKQYRAMLTELLFACGETPLRRGQTSAAEAQLTRLLRAKADVVVIHHAERMGTYALDALRPDRGNPPVVLIAYQDRVLDTVLSQDALMQRVVLLT